MLTPFSTAKLFINRLWHHMIERGEFRTILIIFYGCGRHGRRIGDFLPPTSLWCGRDGGAGEFLPEGEKAKGNVARKKEAQGYRSLLPHSSWRRKLLQEYNYHTEETWWPHLLTVTVAFPEDNSSADERVPLKDEILHDSTASHVFFPSSILKVRARTAKQDITSRSGFVSKFLIGFAIECTYVFNMI